MRRRYVELQLDCATGQVLKVARSCGAGLHAGDGAALIHRHEVTGKVIREGHFINGKCHRDGAPAWIERLPDGHEVLEVYYHRSWLHRDPAEGPAVLMRSLKNPSVITEESYYFEGRPSRHPTDGPWKIIRNAETGEIETKEFLTLKEFTEKSRPGVRWTRVGEIYPDCQTVTYRIDLTKGILIEELYKVSRSLLRRTLPSDLKKNHNIQVILNYQSRRPVLHREDGPASIWYDRETGDERSRRYLQYGLRHRDPAEGPAETTHWEDDHKIEAFHLWDECCRGPDGPWKVIRDQKTGEVVEAEYLTEQGEFAAKRARVASLSLPVLPAKPTPVVPATVTVPPLPAASAPANPEKPPEAAPTKQAQPAEAPHRRQGLLGFLRWPSLSRR